jgi:hypothetical protein
LPARKLVDDICGELIERQARRAHVVALSEYGITEVSIPCISIARCANAQASNRRAASNQTPVR